MSDDTQKPENVSTFSGVLNSNDSGEVVSTKVENKPAPREIKIYLYALPLGGFIRAVDEKDYLAKCEELEEANDVLIEMKEHYDKIHSDFEAAQKKILELGEVTTYERPDLYRIIIAERAKVSELEAEIAQSRDDLKTAYAVIDLDTPSFREQELQQERDQLKSQNAEQQKEIEEQCRLNGMGQERELKLMAEVERLKFNIANLESITANQEAMIERLKSDSSALQRASDKQRIAELELLAESYRAKLANLVNGLDWVDAEYLRSVVDEEGKTHDIPKLIEEARQALESGGK